MLTLQLSNVQEGRQTSIKNHKLNSLIQKLKGKKSLVDASGLDDCIQLKLASQYHNNQGLIWATCIPTSVLVKVWLKSCLGDTDSCSQGAGTTKSPFPPSINIGEPRAHSAVRHGICSRIYPGAGTPSKVVVQRCWRFKDSFSNQTPSKHLMAWQALESWTSDAKYSPSDMNYLPSPGLSLDPATPTFPSEEFRSSSLIQSVPLTVSWLCPVRSK